MTNQHGIPPFSGNEAAENIAKWHEFHFI